MFFSDIHIAVAIASKSHAGSGYQCRLCLPTHGEAACRRPQSFLQRPWQRVDDRSRFYARCMEMASQMCRVSAQSSPVQFTAVPSPSLAAASSSLSPSHPPPQPPATNASPQEFHPAGAQPADLDKSPSPTRDVTARARSRKTVDKKGRSLLR